jgi:hypothetical protein
MAKPQVNVKPAAIGKTGVLTGICRLAYQALLEPRAGTNDDGTPQAPKYTAVLLFEKNDETLPLLKAAMKNAANDFFGEGKVPAGLRNPLRDGDEKASEYAFYKDRIFISASRKASQGAPGIVNQANQPITDQDDIYSGCWVRADINCFGYNQKGNKGVSFGLNNVQKLGDDERFGGKRPATQVFSPVVDAANPFESAAATAGDNVDPFA